MSVFIAIVLTYFAVMFFKTDGYSEFNIIEMDGSYRIVKDPWYAPFLSDLLEEKYKNFEDADEAAKRHRRNYKTW